MPKYVILDRDGTIIVERHHLADPDAVELLPGVGEALRRLQSHAFGLVVVTNQSVVGRGILTKLQLDVIHRRMLQLLEQESVKIDGIYYCPHLPEDGCRCRKPEPGLVELAAEELGFDPADSYLIGNDSCDIELGHRVMARTILVRTGHGADVSSSELSADDFDAADLLAAEAYIARNAFLERRGNRNATGHASHSETD